MTVREILDHLYAPRVIVRRFEETTIPTMCDVMFDGYSKDVPSRLYDMEIDALDPIGNDILAIDLC